MISYTSWYHQAKDENNLGRFFVRKRDDDAYWLEQLKPVQLSEKFY